jgi:hypothetical protein
MTHQSFRGFLAGGAALAVGLVTLSLAGPAPSSDDPALVMVERAIAAHGGADALAEQQALTVRAKGYTRTSSTENPTEPFTSHSTRLLPDKLRQEIRVGMERGEDEPEPADYIVVVNGDKGWMRTGGQVYELTGAPLAAWQLELWVMQVSSLLPLKDPTVKLRLVAEEWLPAHETLIVQHPKQPEVRLSFDKKTALLAKTEYRTTNAAGTPIQQENFYDQFKKVGGVQRFHHYTVRRDGEPFVEAEVLEYKPARTADPKLFAKP